MPMYAGWFGTFWAARPQDVSILHFGAPLEPRTPLGSDFIIGATESRLSLGFITPATNIGATTRLSIDALPLTTVPKVDIDWPVPAGAPPLKTSHLLIDRCCYWSFYDEEFKPPDGIEPGVATLTVSFTNGFFPFDLATNKIQVPVRVKKQEE